MHDYEAAAKTYAALCELDPKHRTASFNLGVCYGNLKQWSEAGDGLPPRLRCRRHALR